MLRSTRSAAVVAMMQSMQPLSDMTPVKQATRPEPRRSAEDGLAVRRGDTSPTGCEVTRRAIQGPGVGTARVEEKAGWRLVLCLGKSAAPHRDGMTSVWGVAAAVLALAADAVMLADAAAQALLALAPDAVMLAYLRSPAFLALALLALVGAYARPQALLAPAFLALVWTLA